MRKLTVLLLLLCLLLGCTPAQPPAPAPAPSEQTPLFVHYIDVGQADCTLLKYGDVDILIDAGNSADGKQVVSYLTRLGVDDLELVIATHPHEDHIGGMYDVLKAFEIEAIWTTTATYNTSVYRSFTEQIAKEKLNLHHPKPGEVHSFDEIQLTVLGPMRENYPDLNDTSIVVMAEFLGKRFLFTGDMESIAETEMMASGADVKADVLKVGHHGSYSSTSYSFLKAVDPDYGVIPVGRNNEYGHPHAAPLTRLIGLGVRVYRTDTMGTVVCATDGNTLAFFQEMNGVVEGVKPAA